jgi:hypothetical protein
MSLQDALQLKLGRLKAPNVFCPFDAIRVSTRTQIGPTRRQDIVIRIATSQVVFLAFAFLLRQALHYLLQA